MDILQDPIGTYRMKGDIRRSPMGSKSWVAEGLKKKIVNGYNTVYLQRFTVTIRYNTAHRI
jgi:hypothetical protein